MKITKIKAFSADLKMRIPYRTALVDRWDSPIVICVINTDEEFYGVGQATTSAPGYSPYDEASEDILTAINRLAPKLEGIDPWEIAEIHRRMDHLTHGHHYAHCAVDLAVYDILAKAAGVPLWRLLGGRLHDSIRVTAPHLGYLSPGEMADEAQAFKEQGYTAINLRAGRDLKEDISILRAIRDRVGEEIDIDIDFSQSLSLHQGRPDGAIRYIRELEKFRINSFEQPVAAWDLKGMARICSAIETPVIADESVFSPQDVLRIAEMGAADGFKVKLIKFGGIFGALQAATVAQNSGLSISVGHGLAGVIQNAAELHFAATLKYFKSPGEMVGFVRMEKDIGTGLEVRRGQISLPELPGLGVNIDLSELRS
jgi:L-Ala-D/L-Glu epimerase